MEGQTLVETVSSPQSAKSGQSIPSSQGQMHGGQLVKSENISRIENSLNRQCAQHGDYLPKDLLENLANPFDGIEDLRPQGNGRLKKSKAFPKVYPKRPPDNLWNHAKTREKFKHLTEQPPCTCGAGRDISFLYDATIAEKKSNPNSPAKETRNKSRNVKISPVSTPHSKRDIDTSDDTYKEIKPLAKDGSFIPDTLIPSEFHIVKNPGVMGMEIHDEKYTTVSDNHGKHLTLFPSLKPSGRQEAVLLKKTMEDLLSRVDEDKEKDTDQPTQIHSLLELVKQEQNIYNIVFNEVIRQVSIECVERGELLAELRKRYANLLDKIPRQVKSLHEEVLAQRALDRRLTEELTRFKSSITLLTKELHEVQEHDREVTKQAIETQNELNAALKESEKNASLLAEYHELYELQRKRLEFQISKLIEERDLWAGASYTLSLKVARRHNLKTAKRLHLHEKAWYKLSSHFASLLSDIDSTQMQELTQHIQCWQDVAEKFDNKLIHYESEAFRKLQHIKKQVNYWGHQFTRVVTPDQGSVHPPQTSIVKKLNEDMKKWEEVFNKEMERFSGDILLSCEDDLIKMSTMIDNWSVVANKIYRRHPTSDGSERPEKEMMITLNHDIEKLHKQFRLRMTGENGLAKGLIHFINVFDTLGNKLNAFSNGGEIMLDPEWVRLADYLQSEWPEVLAELIELVTPQTDEQDMITETSSSETRPDTTVLDVKTLSKVSQKWLTETSNSVENSDAGIHDHVSSSHSNMVRWMVTVLLRLAPNTEEDPLEDANNNNNNSEDTFTTGIGATIISESTLDEIKHKAKIQFKKLTTLTNSLYNCCSGIVNKGATADSDEIADLEVKDLKKMKTECQDWIKTAIILVQEISGEIIHADETEELLDEKETSTQQRQDAVSKTVEYKKNRASDVSDEKLSIATKEESELEEEEADKEKSDVSDDHKEKSETEIVKETQSDENGDAEVQNNAMNERNENNLADIIQSKETDNNDKKNISEISEKENVAMHVIGNDDNVRLQQLDELQVAQEISQERTQQSGNLQESSPSMEALETITKLQNQLVDTEERAQNLEERSITAETKLKEALERIRALERSIRRNSQTSQVSGRSSSQTSTVASNELNNDDLQSETITQ